MGCEDTGKFKEAERKWQKAKILGEELRVSLFDMRV